MPGKPTYEDLEKRIMELETENAGNRRSETRLREVENDYQTLVDNLSAGVYRNTGGSEGRFIRANPAIARMFGYDSVEAFMEVRVSDLYVDPEERRLFVEEVRKTGVVKEWELRLKRRDGSPFWASCTATVKYDESGGVQWMDGIIYDISDRKETEQRLRGSEEEHRTLVENLSAGIYRNTGGPEGRFIHANPAIARMFGYDSVEAFMEVSVADLYVDPEERRLFVEEVRKSGVVKEWELRLKRRDGTPFWASCTATVKYDEDGGVQWMDGIIYDISDRKEAEKALKRTNEVLNNILSASPVGIGLLDKGAIRWANGEMVRMFGFDTRDDYVGKSIRIVYPNDDEYDRVFSEIKKRFKSGEPPEVDARYRRKDGTTFVGHFKLSCPDPDEPSKRAVFAINDISWRTKAETEKLEKEKMQAVLETAGAVCHEMNQPLQGITSLSETLLMSLGREAPETGRLERIMDLTGRMRAITRKLMGITRYETMDYVQGIRIIDLDKSST